MKCPTCGQAHSLIAAAIEKPPMPDRVWVKQNWGFIAGNMPDFSCVKAYDHSGATMGDGWELYQRVAPVATTGQEKSE